MAGPKRPVILAAVQDAALTRSSPRPTGALTVKELKDTLQLSEDKVLFALRKLRREGKLKQERWLVQTEKGKWRNTWVYWVEDK